jgi:cell division GTPase FtsZ
MRRALPSVLLVAAVAGCGGGGNQTTQLTEAQYAAALEKLCTKANHDVAPLKLTTDMAVWKKNGDQAAKIAQETVTGFQALTPPDGLRDAAKRHNKASEGVATSVQDAADAAKNGDVGKFSEAITRQLRFGILSRTAASELGAKGCS